MTFRPLLLACCLLAPAARAATNDTGQSRCFDGEDLAACSPELAGDSAPFPRQDGRFGRDARSPGFDLEPRDAAGLPARAGATPACVLDRVTGLLWQAQPGQPAPWSRLPELVARLNQIRACGRADWRLPARTELVSIVSYGRRTPALEPAPFLGVAPAFCWTADPVVAGVPATGRAGPRAWTVQLMDGASAPAGTEGEFQWLAVSGPPPAAPRFEPLPDGTARDARTGLVWDRCTYGQSGPGCQGSPGKRAWGAALQAAVEANRERYKGHDDWRLPSVKELESLVDVGRAAPATDPVFAGAQSFWYWSSTPRNGDPNLDEEVKAWDVGLDDAHIGFGVHHLQGHVILVRGGDAEDGLAQARPGAP